MDREKTNFINRVEEILHKEESGKVDILNTTDLKDIYHKGGIIFLSDNQDTCAYLRKLSEGIYYFGGLATIASYPQRNINKMIQEVLSYVSGTYILKNIEEIFAITTLEVLAKKAKRTNLVTNVIQISKNKWKIIFNAREYENKSLKAAIKDGCIRYGTK